MKYLCFGDLHGHYDELIELYSICIKGGFDPQKDTAVFLGDYVDGGNQTGHVLKWLQVKQAKYPHWVFLKGNHEDMLLRAFAKDRSDWEWDAWYYQGGIETLESYANDIQNNFNFALDMQWLRKLKLYHEAENHIFVHAGLKPPLPLEAQREEDLLWIRDEFILSNYDWGKRVIYGHTPTEVPRIEKTKVGLDTKPREQGFLCAAYIDDSNMRNAHIFYPPKAEHTMKTQGAKYVFDWPLTYND